uniref:CocE/NonD family hydrolase n=1 Tax=Kordiimonas sp. TaxID=1970157 RepID=UPI003A93AC9B
GQWQSFSDWPVEAAVMTPLYLNQSGALVRAAPESSDAWAEYTYDPRQPTPTIGGAVTSGEPLMTGGAFDQRERKGFFGSVMPGRPLKDRADVLSFETPPLEEGVTVSGPLQARLWVSSDCVDTDFVVKLIDVHPACKGFPDGFAMNISDGILRARYRDSWDAPELMEPGAVYEIVVELFATANLFRKGHRIRLDIASSNFPHFDINPNTGEHEGAWTTTIRARNKVFMDAAHPSCIMLPIVAAG